MQPCCAWPDFYLLFVLYEILFDTWKNNVIRLVEYFFYNCNVCETNWSICYLIFLARVVVVITVSRLNNLCSEKTVWH